MQMRFTFQTTSPDTISESMQAVRESAAKCSEAARPDLPRHAHTILAEDPVWNKRDRRASAPSSSSRRILFGEKCTQDANEYDTEIAARARHLRRSFDEYPMQMRFKF
ncbi:hypothetical protein CEXT_14041 [Caerostris extrusa]|uniref:Uncharacterized protein n=1 Tax=Caerostris extrusa TaxID=172846 RepID=A0AAV4TG80_CAEEX|nr:hypothetical protein CEXT_14041 [Caerostris extrusa]